MRSFGIRVGLRFKDKCPYKRMGEIHRGASHVKTEAGNGVMIQLQVKE